MYKLLLAILLLFCVVTGHSQTQAEMNEQASKRYQQVDKQLNELYQRILTKHKANTNFIKNIKASQRLWLQFRDAEMKAIFPEMPAEYGSMFPLCWAINLEALTNERIKRLRMWDTN